MAAVVLEELSSAALPSLCLKHYLTLYSENLPTPIPIDSTNRVKPYRSANTKFRKTQKAEGSLENI